jgi:hypothetical protein
MWGVYMMGISNLIVLALIGCNRDFYFQLHAFINQIAVLN